MFQKPTFGSAGSSGFGSFNAGTSSTPFGGFKPTTSTTGFGTPSAFGASTSNQPTTGLFGSTNTTGGLFGSTNTAAPAPTFGTSAGGFGFGSTTNTGGLFGSTDTSSGLFGNTQNTSAFGVKPAGFGFGSTPTAGTNVGGLFGSSATPGTSLFGQQNTTLGGGGLFSNTTGAFGQQQPTGTGHVKYNPVVGTDVVVKSGSSQNVNIKHHCITCMKEYENKSLEELRLEDYLAGRKGSSGGMFGGFTQQTENKPLFGSNTFGQPATTTAPSVFGGGGLGTGGGFGQTSTFSFGGNNQNTTNTSGLFSANKPVFGATPTTGTSLFGAATTQASTFGTNTSTFGFGASTQNQQTGGIFGAKTNASAFGTAPTGGGFGFGGGMFGAKTTQTAAPTFGTSTTGFGSLSGGFGTNTSTSGGLFSANNTFGKPTTTQPTFGFTNPSTGLGTGLGAGLGTNTFQAKPTGAPFAGLGGGSIFQQPQPTNTFRTGLDSGLGGGLFANSTLGNSGLGLGAFNTNTTALPNAGLGASAVNVHEQMLTLAARPYGDSPLFKDLLPDSSITADDILKSTNPATVKAVLDSAQGNAYRVTSPTGLRLKVHPRGTIITHDKKSLFDGLEESDASLEDKLCLKPSRKRLVLRPNQKNNQTGNDSLDSREQLNNSKNRSLEEPSQEIGSTIDKENNIHNKPEDIERVKRQVNFNNNDSESNTERNGSWLGSSKHSWSDKEKPVDSEPSPRLYPNLDKELPIQMSERRASWLTTKPLRKTAAYTSDEVENSVRELGVRSELVSLEKENIDTVSISEEENVSREAPPHPSGIKLTRPGYYTIPSLDELIKYIRADGSCVVPHLTIGRKNYGNVFFDCEIDVAGLDLDALVHFLNKEVIVYPEDADKPPVGEGLNRRAIVTLDRIWPIDKTEKRPITDPDRLLKMDYEGKLRRVCDKHDTKFIEYRPQTGSWVFRVEHFSKYGLTDSDEEDDITPEVLKRQLVKETLQTTAVLAPKQPLAVSTPGLVGVGLGGGLGLGLTGGLTGIGSIGLPEDSLLAMQQTSLNVLNGASKACEMDTTENNTESQSLYQDMKRGFGVKSPTSELARLENRQSHHIQLMKASLYADTDMDEVVSVSTGDQLVPRPATRRHIKSPSVPPTIQHYEPELMETTPTPTYSEEIPMRPLIVQPHSIVLKYHRAVPPFKKTIAGRLQAGYIADVALCRARHSRVGFATGMKLAYVSTHDAMSNLPTSADLSELDNYVRGRSEEDWSESVVVRLALGQTDNTNMQDILTRHLTTLLEYSTPSACSEDQCPQYRMLESPQDRRAVLLKYIQEAELGQRENARFGVKGSYFHQVWKLCDALWGADLENDGIPGTDELSIVNRHRKLLAWLREVVSEITDRKLAVPNTGEKEDEADGHSFRIWTLLLGGRELEACRLARQHGDLHLAMLIAQAGGSPTFRSLVRRQLSLWSECGADGLIASNKLATLELISGELHGHKLTDAEWPQAFHAAARYLCPQVPSLEQVVRTYESLFCEKGDSEFDLSTLDPDETDVKIPLPPYIGEYDVTYEQNNKQRRVLDVRYELIRARAFNSRPKLQPASYTPDPLDYSLCFLLGTWFGNPSIESITGLASQLEASGSWHLAVQVLTYHPIEHVRGALIRGVLSRHAPSRAHSALLESQLQLIKRLKVPLKWLLLAQAHRAKYEHLPAVEAEHLVNAGQWNLAHRLLIEDLLPEVVLSDNLQSISALLEKMNEAAKRHEVSGWESGGEALYHYMHVCNEMRVACVSESEEDRSQVASRLQALRHRLAAAARALAPLPTKTARHAAARAEMGARVVQLALLGGGPAPHLAALLKALRLPPDYTAHAQYKITTELAEQASELCLESASSSPQSSHHRTTDR